MTNSARLALPHIEAGQAQKEWTHNEALALIDIVVQAVVEAVGVDAPPTTPALGACWIVGAAPSGAWSGRGGAIAGWTEGGWRFVGPREGLAAWSRADATTVRRRDGVWRLDRSAPVAAPAGGAIIDTESRAAIAVMLTMFRDRGWLA